jgi:hypothetical protein
MLRNKTPVAIVSEIKEAIEEDYMRCDMACKIRRNSTKNCSIYLYIPSRHPWFQILQADIGLGIRSTGFPDVVFKRWDQVPYSWPRSSITLYWDHPNPSALSADYYKPERTQTFEKCRNILNAFADQADLAARKHVPLIVIRE